MNTQNQDSVSHRETPQTENPMKTEHKKEIRDTTGNILRPGMYGYEERLAASVESPRLAVQTSHDSATQNQPKKI